MIKAALPFIKDSICGIFNKSMELGKFPKMLKKAIITPIFKDKGNKNDIRNYRPISILPTISKIFEKIVFIRLYEFLSNTGFFYKLQSGFRSGDSPVYQLIEITHFIYDKLSKGEEVIGVYLDISKAFDKVWHDGLIFKLKRAGIRGQLLSWITSYLNGRYQYVTIDGTNSFSKPILAGVPQGSILGPLLFLVYINDITEGIDSVCHLFADDSNLLKSTKNIQPAVESINRDLSKINDWCNKWLVTMNDDKIKTILYSRKVNPSVLVGITYNNFPVVPVNVVKHLGIHFDSKMTWKPHLEHVISKSRDTLYYINILKHKISSIHLLTYYKSFIRPIIEYGLTVWGNCSDYDELNKIQYQATKSITGAMRGSSQDKLNHLLGLPTIKTRYDLLTVATIRKIYHGNAPSYLCDILLQYRPQIAYALRQNFKLTPALNLYNSFFEAGIKLWNSLNITNRQSVLNDRSFKTDILKLWKTPSKSFCLRHSSSRRSEIHLNRILVNFSQLKGDLYDHHIIAINTCACGNYTENLQHYLFECNRYARQRTRLMNALLEYNIISVRQFNNPNPRTLIRLINKKAFEAKNQNLLKCLQIFIRDSARFI